MTEKNNDDTRNVSYELPADRVERQRDQEGRGVSKGALKNFAIVALAAGMLVQYYNSNRNVTITELEERLKAMENDGKGQEAILEDKEVDTEPIKEIEIAVPDVQAQEEAKQEGQTQEQEKTDIRKEIEAERTYSFSQLVATINHFPGTVEKDGLLYWDINESAGQITVTRPYGELHEDNPHNEIVEFEFYPDHERKDKGAIFEWNELDIRANVPAGAFWIKTDSTGGAVKIEYFDEKGNVIQKHEGEMVMVEWKDKDGKTRNAIQFRDEITGETRPAAFQTHEIKFDDETGKAVDIEYPYHTAKVTFEPTPGSYMQLVTGPTIHFNPDNPYGPDHDQGFGFYLWDQKGKTK